MGAGGSAGRKFASDVNILYISIPLPNWGVGLTLTPRAAHGDAQKARLKNSFFFREFDETGLQNRWLAGEAVMENTPHVS
jgi:hypothetical protein